MKYFFKYMGIVALAIFSFYYTDRVIELSKENDAVLVSINEYAKEVDTKCREGYITDEGIILGISGIVVDKSKSYSNMKGVGYKKELIEYRKNSCILTKEDNLDKYILKANPLKNSTSIVIFIDSLDYVNEFKKLAEEKNIEISFVLNNASLNYIDSLKEIYNNNFIFSGRSQEELKNFKKVLKEIDKEYITYCADYNDNILEICKEEKINTIKVKNVIEKDLLSEVKNIEKGDILFIKENKFNLEEFSATINYINGRGIKILSLNSLLE